MINRNGPKGAGVALSMKWSRQTLLQSFEVGFQTPVPSRFAALLMETRHFQFKPASSGKEKLDCLFPHPGTQQRDGIVIESTE